MLYFITFEPKSKFEAFPLNLQLSPFFHFFWRQAQTKWENFLMKKLFPFLLITFDSFEFCPGAIWCWRFATPTEALSNTPNQRHYSRWTPPKNPSLHSPFSFTLFGEWSEWNSLITLRCGVCKEFMIIVPRPTVDFDVTANGDVLSHASASRKFSELIKYWQSV